VVHDPEEGGRRLHHAIRLRQGDAQQIPDPHALGIAAEDLLVDLNGAGVVPPLETGVALGP
jgi:hypothetical protein